MANNSKTILAAIDTSEASRSVFKETLVLASTIRAQVVIVAVTPNYEGNMNRFCIKNSEQQLNEPFRTILQEAIDYATSLGLNMRTIHRKGRPCDEILTAAREEKASLIVLGSSRRYQVERMLLGRTIAEIIARSHCDVLLVPEYSEIRFNNILVGVSDSPGSTEAQRRALDVALSYGSQLHGLHAIDIPSERSLRYGVAQDAERKAGKILQKFIAMAKEVELSVTYAMRWNAPEICLVNYAKENSIHLIVLGTHEDMSLIEMIGGSIIERLASLTPCPVLVAKKLSPSSGGAAVPVFTFEH